MVIAVLAGPSSRLYVPEGAALPSSYSMLGGSENPISESGVWLNGETNGIDFGDVQKVGGITYGTTITAEGGALNDSCAVLDSSKFSIGADHEVIAFLSKPDSGYTPPASHECEIFLRGTISANFVSTYEVLIPWSGALQIVRWNGPIATPVTFQDEFTNTDDGTNLDGTRIRARIVGVTITVWKKHPAEAEFQIASCDTSSSANNGVNRLLTGMPGQSFFCRTGGTLGKYGFSAWSTSSL